MFSGLSFFKNCFDFFLLAFFCTAPGFSLNILTGEANPHNFGKNFVIFGPGGDGEKKTHAMSDPRPSVGGGKKTIKKNFQGDGRIWVRWGFRKKVFGKIGF